MATIKIKNPEYVEGESNKWIPLSKFVQSTADKVVKNDGDGTKYLANDGKYKTISFDGLATEEWVEEQGYLTEYVDTVYDDTEIKERLDSLESVTSTAVQPDAIVDMETKTNASATYATKDELNTHATEAKEYTDTVITNLVNAAPDTLDTLGELAQAILDNEDVVELLEQSVTNKQDVIEDLDTIRNGAQLGSTALQSYTEQYTGTIVSINNTITNIEVVEALPESPQSTTLYLITE